VEAGKVALLANKLDATAVADVTAALTSKEWIVRAVAARLASVTGQVDLADAIATQFAVERDPYSATEQVRALLNLRGASAAESVGGRLGLAGARSSMAFLEWMARAQPDRLADWLPKVLPHLLDNINSVTALLQSVIRHPGSSAESLLATWLRASTPEGWRSFLNRQPLDPTRQDHAAVFVAAMKSADAEIREITIWHLVGLTADTPIPASLLDESSDAVSASRGAWEALGWEMWGRGHGRPRTDKSDIVLALGGSHAEEARTLIRMNMLTASELNAFRKVLGDRFPKVASEPRGRDLKPNGAAMRTLPPMWPGFLGGLLEAAGCRIEGGPRYAAARTFYRPDGRVERMEVDSGVLGPECTNAVRAAFRLVQEDIEYRHPAGVAEWVVLPISRDFLTCVDDPSATVADDLPPVGSGGLVPPRKTRHVPPEYPAALQKDRVQGVAVLEGTVETSGCIGTLKVLHTTANGQLDYAALQAVSAWRFEPTQLNGRSVRSIMTATVNFKLQ